MFWTHTRGHVSGHEAGACFGHTPGDMFRGHGAGACFGHTPGDMFRGYEAGTCCSHLFPHVKSFFCQKVMLHKIQLVINNNHEVNNN